jgi:hypothetical protein
MWMGGTVPLGYKLGNRKLVVDPQAADAVRWIFRKYLQLKSVRLLREELATNLPGALAGLFGTAGEGTHPSSWSRGKFYYLLTNPTYVGKVRHRKSIYDGAHEAIIDSELFDQVQSSLKGTTSRSSLADQWRWFSLAHRNPVRRTRQPIWSRVHNEPR